MSTSPIRLNPELISAAEKVALMQKRSTPKQIEFWADLGRAVERVIDLSDVFAVLQGLKRLKLENVESVSVDPDDVFSDLQMSAGEDRLSGQVSVSEVYYEASRKYPGMLDQVELASGRRQTGQFRNGQFEPRP